MTTSRPQGFDRCAVVAKAFQLQPQPAWDFSTTGVGKARQLGEIVDRHDAWHDRYFHTLLAHFVDKGEIRIRVKKYWVIAASAPALALRTKLAMSACRRCLGMVFRVGGHSMWNQSPCSARMNSTSSLA